MFRFVCVQPCNGRAFVFDSNACKFITDFDEDVLRDMVQDQWGDQFDLEDVEFFELGEQKPLTFEKTVSYTINQKD